jgi:hypothetical protein
MKGPEIMNTIEHTFGQHTYKPLTAALLLALAACSQHPSQTDTSGAASTAAAEAQAPASASSSTVASEQQDEADENGNNAAAKVVTQPTAGTGPRVKGIALGDSPETVRAAALALIPQGSQCHIDEKADASNPFLNLAIQTPYGIALNCGTAPAQPDYIAFFEFRDRALTKFTFGADLSVSAFNAGQMAAKDFAQTFIDAYDIPQLAPSEDQHFLTYRDADHGWAVDLFPDESFKVYAITTASAQAKSFN